MPQTSRPSVSAGRPKHLGTIAGAVLRQSWVPVLTLVLVVLASCQLPNSLQMFPSTWNFEFSWTLLVRVLPLQSSASTVSNGRLKLFLLQALATPHRAFVSIMASSADRIPSRSPTRSQYRTGQASRGLLSVPTYESK